MISEVASVGSGKKGHGYGGGMITEPARAYFRTKERIAFQDHHSERHEDLQGD